MQVSGIREIIKKGESIQVEFKEIGRADELGSGVRKLFKYCKVYTGIDSQLIEEDIFKIIIPLKVKGTIHSTLQRFTMQATGQVTPQATPQVTPQATPQVSMQGERVKKIIKFCKTPRAREEIQQFLKLKDREYFRKEILNPLLEEGILHPTIPDKLTSPNQKYYSNKSEKNT